MLLTFGARRPYLEFDDNKHFFRALGFLVRSQEIGACRFVLENNQNQGAWGHECRIQIFSRLEEFQELFRGRVSAGVGNCLGRINCNQYLEYLAGNHNFNFQIEINNRLIRSSVPLAHLEDYDLGYNE
ncbi:hypothetical protein D1115_12190 [Vibrio alfacsensis]|uniref:Uncharacterized protein n=1 Tax=Vibrio alfacsensis TaxID=1074311 RepID=A0ABM6YVE6_9VIBR|nr:hypothetical protein [Vibrio alfacsensis]AXY01780.1 hypothetical protein D1115_12190 [Vibrio alfacsensis]BBM65511.1 hypothetical protein VA249_21570 [Vibrio alfacsensis]